MRRLLPCRTEHGSIYNMEHEQAAENKNLLDLVAKIASSDEPIDVFTMPEHPQFADYKE